MGPQNREGKEKGGGTGGSSGACKGRLEIWMTNADVLTQEKIIELKSRLKEKPPDLIAISEVKPKTKKHHLELVHYALDGYDMDYVNLTDECGRGMILYISKMLDFNVIAPHKITTMKEAQFVEINMVGGKLLFCSVYRSPNSTTENNDALNTLLGHLSNYDYKYTVIAGDMNYPKIDWEYMTTKSNHVDKEFKFVEAVRDSFNTQIVDRPTRGRGSDNPSLLDIILVNDITIVQNLEHMSPLGKSDHAVLKLTLNCQCAKTTHTKTRYSYDKGDYHKLRENMDIDWITILNKNSDNVDAQWEEFKEIYNTAVNQSIPTRKIKSGKFQHPIPLDKETRTKINRKCRLWKEYMATKNPATYTAYCKVRNQVRRITRKATKLYEKDIAAQAKDNPKKFWTYVRSKTKRREDIPNLNKPDNTTTSTNQEKAELLAEYFTSVFTNEPDGHWDVPEPTSVHNGLVDTSRNAVHKILGKIKTSKSPGPDGIHPRVLSELKEVISLPLSIVFETSLRT